MPVAEIIAIGTELLLGEIQDTNTRYLARVLRDHGIDLYRTMMIGDNAHRVADAVNEALQRADIVITTGGLGPTVDDPAREALALAFEVELVYVPELWEQIESRFMRFNRKPTENNRRQAYIPAGSLPVENPVGTAPCFILERGTKCVFSLPGVPKEMEYLLEHAVMPYLIKHYDLSGIIKAKVFHTIGLGESAVDDLIGDLELLSNPTVGLLAHSGQVDVRVTAKAASEYQADALIADCEKTLRERLKTWIYGADAETIDEVVCKLLVGKQLKAACVARGMDVSALTARASAAGCGNLTFFSADDAKSLPADTPLRISVQVEDAGQRHIIEIQTEYRGQKTESNYSFGGPPALAALWAVNSLYAALYEVLVASE